MPQIQILPATTAHQTQAAQKFPDLLPDHWREGQNRRSFTALDAFGNIVGHCRGIDNTFHPASRTLALEMDSVAAGIELVRAQLELSPLELSYKVREQDVTYLEVFSHFNTSLVQLMPPWKFRIEEQAKTWAEAALQASKMPDSYQIQKISDEHLPQIAALQAQQYVAQHTSWLPSAPAKVLEEAFLEDYLDDPQAFDRAHSLALFNADGSPAIIAAALLVFGQLGNAAEPPEVVVVSRNYNTEAGWAEVKVLLATLFNRLALNTDLCLDSHLSMEAEYEFYQQVPGRVLDEPEFGWMGILRILPPASSTASSVSATHTSDSKPPTTASDADALSGIADALIPAEAAWARRFVG